KFSHLESSELMSRLTIYTHEYLNCQVTKRFKRELEYKKIIEKMIMKFLHNEIYVNYEMPHKILTDNSVNLIEEAVRYFMSQLQIRYYRTISYYSQMNRKIKHLNKILSNMLMKYL
ncbi:hypothetical protein BDBG_18084, partial [Blastomyces gilchristii SLH14081]